MKYYKNSGTQKDRRIFNAVKILFVFLFVISCNPETKGGSTNTGNYEKRSFWVNDLKEEKKWDRITAYLVYQTDKANLWVRDADLNKISAELIKEYGDYFTNESYPLVSGQVYQITDFFEEKGGRINILFYDSESGSAGYFWEKDFYENGSIDGIKSNETNIFYINIKSAVDSQNQSYAAQFTKGTLTHEFQHMCQAHYFVFDETGSKQIPLDSWANETCSVLLESIYASQAPIYIDSYNTDNDNKFSTGKTSFIDWNNDFTQYTVVSLFGLFMTSQIEEKNRNALIKTWIGMSGDGNTSLHELIGVLEDENIAYWKTDVTDIENDSAIIVKWGELLTDFMKGIAGVNTSYTEYITKLSPGKSIKTVINTTDKIELEASGFLFSKTKVADAESTVINDAGTSGTLVYQCLFHSGLPRWNDQDEYEMPSPLAEELKNIIKTKTRSSKLQRTYSTYKFNRSMTSKNFSLDNIKRTSYGTRSDDTSKGKIECFYIKIEQ